MLDCLMVLASTKCHWTSQGHRNATLVQGCRVDPSLKPAGSVEPEVLVVLEKHPLRWCLYAVLGFRGPEATGIEENTTAVFVFDPLQAALSRSVFLMMTVQT